MEERVDERIARLEREKRKIDQEAQQERADAQSAGQETDAGQKMTLEEMLAAVRTGSVTFPGGKTHNLDIRHYFEDEVPMAVIRNFYTGVKEDTGVAVYVNHDWNVSQLLTVSDTKLERSGIGEWKKQVVEGMKAQGVYAKVLKEAALENLDYLAFLTPTGKGRVYNLIFRIFSGSGRVVGNYNCMEKEQDTYGLLLEACILWLNEQLAGNSGEGARQDG